MTTVSRIPEPERLDDLTFHPSAEPTIGVELELQILDRESRNLVPGAPRLLKACGEEAVPGVAAELMQSMVEIRTDVCQNAGQVREQLLPRVQRVVNIARSLGFDLALAGTHPFHRAGASAISPAERYERIVDRLAWLTYQREVFGLHVHVGVPGGDLALGVINRLVQYLPHLLALSANSPFWQGVDTGLASSRAALYRLLPHAGVPRYFAKWKDFRTFCQVMKDCKAIASFKDIYWDIRPRPDFGTIEFRICDTPASLADVFGLATLTRSLVISSLRLLQERPHLQRGDMRRHWIAVENKWLATRHGLAAIYIRTPAGKRRPLAKDVEDLLKKMAPIAAESGDQTFLDVFKPGKFESGADRQRRIYREKGDWKPVVDDMVQRLAAELERAGTS
jgi:carboxylate-amine ligase